MKIALNKHDIRDFFISWGWLVLAIVFLSYLLWFYPISTIDSIKGYEKINFFIEGYSLKENTVQQDLLSSLKEDGVVEVNLYSFYPGSDSRIYDNYGVQSDFVILSQSDLDAMFPSGSENVVASKFVPFSDALKKETMSVDDYSYYQVKGQDYALKVYDASFANYNVQHPFDSLVNFTKDGADPLSYYLLLNAQTLNLKPYSSRSVTSNAIKALTYFLKTYHA